MTAAASPVFTLPQRGLFDVIAANDVAALLTLVRGDNPFDVSPGMRLIRSKKRNDPRPYAEDATVLASTEVEVDVAGIPRAKDIRGNGAAHVAAGNGLVTMLKILLGECGCSVHECNEEGQTPLHVAAIHGHLDCVRVLCECGADPLHPTSRAPPLLSPSTSSFWCGRSPLFLAHYRQHAAVVKFLLPFYAQFLENTCDGQAATHTWEKAALEANAPLLSLLLDALDCRHGTPEGPLPLDFGFDVEAALEEALPTLLTALLPTDSTVAPPLLYCFHRLVQLGYVDADTVVSDASGSVASVRDRVLAAAQVEAWRVLVAEKQLEAHTCAVEAVGAYECDAGNGAAALRLLIAEAAARRAYEDAKKAFLLRGEGASRRAALLQTREEWKKLQQRLEEEGIAPVSSQGV